jgi:hypothetical protein
MTAGTIAAQMTAMESSDVALIVTTPLRYRGMDHGGTKVTQLLCRFLRRSAFFGSNVPVG